MGGVISYKSRNIYNFIIYKENRTAILAQLSAAQAEKRELEAELARYRECDPEVIDEMKKEIKVAKEAANRWTGKSDDFL